MGLYLENVKRIAAGLMAISLLLPLSSCEVKGETRVHYSLSDVNLSDAGSVGVGIFLAALFVLPLVFLFIYRKGLFSILGRIALAVMGLYMVSYGQYFMSHKLLIGWYAYTSGASILLIVSLAEFGGLLWKSLTKRRARIRQMADPTIDAPP